MRSHFPLPALVPVKEANMDDNTRTQNELIDLGAASELTQGADAEAVEQFVLIKRELE